MLFFCSKLPESKENLIIEVNIHYFEQLVLQWAFSLVVVCLDPFGSS